MVDSGVDVFGGMWNDTDGPYLEEFIDGSIMWIVSYLYTLWFVKI